MHIHRLDGCAPTPLAHYLKALGILRLVGEQADEEARGWWEGERFLLATRLAAADIEEFFLLRYRPTSFVAPWSRGSGFYQTEDPGLAPLESSNAPRLQPYREGIAASRVYLVELEAADARVRSIKAEPKQKGRSKQQRDQLRQSPQYKQRLAEAERGFKLLKGDLIPRLRSAWRGTHRDWMDAALVLDDARTARFPALLGTGGNDGRLDFTNNFMQRLGDVFDLSSASATPRATAAPWLASALWGTPVEGCLPDRAVGQFLPGTAGGANNVNGAEGTSLLNPFDFILTMEGCLLMRAHAARRLDVQGASRAAAPFVVAANAAGYASAAESDESARGEQWMPLWAQPMTLAETRRLFAEGRAQLGHSTAAQPLDLALAAARLGVARGVNAFQRFGYIERNGQSNLAVPLGRFDVRVSKSMLLDCLDDIAPWTARLYRASADDDATLRLRQVARRLGDRLFDLTQRSDEPARWQDLLALMAEVEAVMKTGSGFKAQPIPALRPEWAQAADDGSAEFRLALSFALQARAFRRDDGRPLDAIRRHWLPLDQSRRRPRFATTGDAMRQRLDRRPEVVMHGRSGIDDAVALVERRLVEAAGNGHRGFPLRPAPRAFAHLADLAAWLVGRVDADRTLLLARALMALEGHSWAEQIVPIANPNTTTHAEWPDDAWLAVRLAHLPWKLPNGREVACDPAILRRLAGGDAGTAVELSLRRLHAVGVRASVRVAIVAPPVARRWAAALAFPITASTAARLVRRLDPSFAQEQLA